MNTLYLAALTSEQLFDPNLPLGEKLSVGWKVAVMGMAIVFVILALLWGCLVLFRVIFYDLPKRRAARCTAEEEAAAPAPAAETAAADIGSEEQIVAAITAAIAASLGETSPAFRVVSFRKIQK